MSADTEDEIEGRIFALVAELNRTITAHTDGVCAEHSDTIRTAALTLLLTVHASGLAEKKLGRAPTVGEVVEYCQRAPFAETCTYMRKRFAP